MAERVQLSSGDGALVAAIDRRSGSLVRLCANDNSWELLGGARCAKPFDLLLPRRERHRNRTGPVPQASPEVLELEGGKGVELRWDHVVAEDGGTFDISVVVNYSLDAGALVCRTSVANQSELVVENVVAPCLTDVQPPPGHGELGFFTYEYAGARRLRLRPHFDNVPGYFGVDRPTALQQPHACTVPGSPFVLLDFDGGGLYVGVDEPRAELLTWVAELEPGYSDSIDSTAPDGPLIGGKDVRIEFSPVHVPYVIPGETRALPALRLRFYSGGWQDGAAVYRDRRRAWMGSSKPPAWAAEPHSWQQVQMNSPEGERRYKFSDLRGIAQECAERGVRAVQLVGWNDGGQDQNNPSHDPDPLLGGAEGLRRAIAECHELGVKIVLFSKFVWSDRASRRFREELAPLAVRDPYGDYYVHPGYRYQTVTQLLDINTKRLVPMCFSTDGWAGVCRQEFKKVLDVGADGILYDECFHHVPALACFDMSHGHRYGQPVAAHDVEFVRWLREQSDSLPYDFLYAGEACTDWQLSEYHVSYHRSESTTHVPLMRWLRPDALLMTAVTGFDDRNMVNQCLLYRYIVSYEPYNFKGRLADMPLTVAYGQKMDALRAELREWLWDGEFRGTKGAVVTDQATGRSHAPFSVFESRRDGSLAVVVANYSRQPVVVDVVVGGAPLARHRLVGTDDWHEPADGIALPARSAAVVLGPGAEQAAEATSAR